MNPKVTVIIPVYNMEKYITECLESVVKQTLQDIEIIVIDDGSTDQTGKIVDRYALQYSKVKVYHQENKGLYKTREIALERAHGEYIGWVDADDFVASDMFEILYREAVKNESELVYCDYAWYPEKIKTKEKWFRVGYGSR